ncbi:unnamed protein product, partial [Dibothriocephalus latus]
MVWLRLTKFYLKRTDEADKSRFLLLGLSPDYLAKALEENLSDETPFESLCYRLANLFSNTPTLREALHRLNSRKLRPDESITSLVNDTERLMAVAFPTLNEDDTDALVLHYFTEALPDPELRRQTLLVSRSAASLLSPPAQPQRHDLPQPLPPIIVLFYHSRPSGRRPSSNANRFSGPRRFPRYQNNFFPRGPRYPPHDNQHSCACDRAS